MKLFGGTVHAALVHAATAYDRRQSTKRDYNHYALAIYLWRIHEVEKDIAAGKPMRVALISGFTGRLLDVLLVAVGEPRHTRDEMANQDYAYRSVKTRADSEWR